MNPQSILRRNQLRQIVGLSLATIDRMRRRGDFPDPVRLTGAKGQAVGWKVQSILDFLASRQPKTSGV